MNSKFGEIGPWTTELASLERLKKKIQLIMEKMTSHFLCYFSSDDTYRQWEHAQKLGRVRNSARSDNCRVFMATDNDII